MGVTERLARASSRHPGRTVGGWLGAIVLALGLAAAFLPGNLTTTGHVTGNPESKQAEDLFHTRFPPDSRGVDELIVVRSPRRTVGQPEFKAFVTKLLSQADATGVVYRASTYYETHDPAQVSRDRHATLIGIQRKADVDPLLSFVQRSNGENGFAVVMTGEGTLDHDFNDLSQHDLKTGELQFGLPAALVILILVFGAVVAGLIPLVMAMVAIVVALVLLALVLLRSAVGVVPPFLLRALLAVSIDEEGARVAGLPVPVLNAVISMLAALTIGISMRIVGILLIAALMVLPVIAAQRIAWSLRSTMGLSIVVGLASVLAGLTVSYYGDLPPGGTIVLAATGFFLASSATEFISARI